MDGVNRMKLLSREDILHALGSLATELPPSSPVEIFIGGGAALVLLYSAREATKDVDAFAMVSSNPPEVAQLHAGLPSPWAFPRTG